MLKSGSLGKNLLDNEKLSGEKCKYLLTCE